MFVLLRARHATIPKEKKRWESKKQSYIEGNSPQGIKRWVERVIAMDYDYNKAETVAFKERIPIKIGATADPFPMVERKELITYDCLKVFDEYDYPVQISTKNPEVFLEYADEFKNSNIALNISCSFCDDDIARQIECGAISPSRRFEAMKKLSQMGYKITVRIQPFILHYSEKVAERFVKTIAENGAWAFQTEGLKLRVAMPQNEKEIYKKIGDVLGFDILDEFKKNGVIEGGDRVYNEEDKRSMLQTYDELSKKYGIKFFNADNLVDKKYGCGCECCGTEFLRDHKIWGGASRAFAFPNKQVDCSEELGKCYVNFTRANALKKEFPTIQQVCDKYLKTKNDKESQLTLF